MSLKDRFAEAAKGEPCPYQLMVNSLPPTEQEALAKAWKDGLSQRLILRALRAEGYKTSNEAIMAHKTGNCRCPK